MSCSACKEYNFSFIQCFYCCILGKQCGKCTAYERCKYFCLHACITENIRYIDTVHNCCKHSDLVSLHTVDRLTGSSSPEVTSTCYDCNLYPIIYKLLYLLGYTHTGSFVKSCLFIACESLPAEF